MRNTLANILKKFPEKKIVVIGDIMLDEYIYGDVSRISPEAPIPVVKVKNRYYDLGGAGNVASNIATLKGAASIFSFIGNDPQAKILENLLKEKNIDYFLDNNFRTTFKSRIIGNNQQIARCDEEDTEEKFFTESMKQNLLEKSSQADIIVISDYAKGAITSDLMNLLKENKHKIIVGPKPRNKSLYQRVRLVVPNAKEASEMSGCQIDDIEGSIRLLNQDLGSDILITLGERGMMFYTDKKFEIPTQAREVYDVSGAGDTVVAALSMALASGASLEESAIIANNAAGIAVEQRGTYSVSLGELENRILLEERKILNFKELQNIVYDLKLRNKKIVWTNGCFDILHTGHTTYLSQAKKQGDILIVGINSDSSIKAIKGPDRPINSELDRAEILTNLSCVDYVIIYPEINSEIYLKELKPDFYVKGGDYTIDTIHQGEKKIVEDYSGKIIILPPVPGKSTTNILKKIENKYE